LTAVFLVTIDPDAPHLPPLCSDHWRTAAQRVQRCADRDSRFSDPFAHTAAPDGHRH